MAVQADGKLSRYANQPSAMTNNNNSSALLYKTLLFALNTYLRKHFLNLPTCHLSQKTSWAGSRKLTFDAASVFSDLPLATLRISPVISPDDISKRTSDLENKLKSRHLLPNDVIGDRYNYYSAISFLATEHQENHLSFCQSVADHIKSQGELFGGILNISKSDFSKYVSSLRSTGNYDYVGETTALAEADLFRCEVYIHIACAEPLIYKPHDNIVEHSPIQLTFFELAHYKAVVDIDNGDVHLN